MNHIDLIARFEVEVLMFGQWIRACEPTVSRFRADERKAEIDASLGVRTPARVRFVQLRDGVTVHSEVLS